MNAQQKLVAEVFRRDPGTAIEALYKALGTESQNVIKAFLAETGHIVASVVQRKIDEYASLAQELDPSLGDATLSEASNSMKSKSKGKKKNK